MKAWKPKSPSAMDKSKAIICSSSSFTLRMNESMNEKLYLHEKFNSGEAGLSFLSFFRKLRNKRKILLILSNT
jgi:hypothetical protein